MRLLALLGLTASSSLGQVLYETVKLVSDDVAIGDQFGFCVSIDGGVLAVGAVRDDDAGESSGSAYLFDASLTSTSFGSQLAKLLPVDGAPGDQFGHSVAAGGGVVLVGAIFDDDRGVSSGSAYLFDADPGSPTFGTQLAKLLADDGAPGDLFGIRAAISDGVAVISTWYDDDLGSESGAAYLFGAVPGSPDFGQQLAKLLPDDGAAGDHFGRTVSIGGGVAIVGAHRDNDLGWDSGSAYVFDVDPASPSFGQQLIKLLPDDGATGEHFGCCGLDIGGGVAIIGAAGDNDNGTDSGSAYLFDVDPKSPGFGHQIAKLLSSDGAVGDNFGGAAAVSDGLGVVSANRDDDNGENSGSAYVFDTDPGSLSLGFEKHKLLPTDGGAGDWFGSVEISNGLIAIGAIGNEAFSGGVYLFDIQPCSPIDFAGPFGVLDLADIVAFVTAFDNMSVIADLADPVGVWDLADVVSFVIAFSAGCP